MKKLKKILFDGQPDFRIRIFNLLALGGITISYVMAVLCLLVGNDSVTGLVNFLAGTMAVFLLYYTNQSGRYQMGYLITIIVVFLIGFPILFFTGGGYKGSMPCFFIFACLFTVFMLDTKKAIFFVSIELTVYAFCCVYAHLNPACVIPLSGDLSLTFDIILGFVVVSLVLGTVIMLILRLYRQQQQSLELAREEAEAASRAKSTFLANMSHEIRSPLNTILAMNSLIERNSVSREIQDYARDIQRSGKMLLEIISNILDLSKIEAGKFDVENRPYQVTSLLSDLILSCELQTEKKGLQFHYEIDQMIPTVLIGSPLHITQIVMNFVSNAVKYTKAGTVTLLAEAKEADHPGYRMMRITVKDMGMGIGQEGLKDLFLSFERGKQPDGQRTEGTGLGLAIAKEIADRLGGQIMVESQKGKGSAFCMELPQKVESFEPIGPCGQWLMRDTQDSEYGSFLAPEGRVLIVDDNDENRKVFCALLEPTMVQIDTAASGREAIEMVKRKNYHVIFMDYMMPEMDGIETLQLMKKEHLADGTAIIALTADAVTGTREKLLREGFSAYLSKPVGTGSLESAILACLPADLVTRTDHQVPALIGDEKMSFIKDRLASYDIILENGLIYSGNDLILYCKRAYYFIEAYPKARESAERSFHEKDFENLVFPIHSLKSSAQAIGAEDLQHISARIEKRSGDLSYFENSMPLLFLEWQRAYDGLRWLLDELNEFLPKSEAEPDNEKLSPFAYGRRAVLAVRMCNWTQARCDVAALLDLEEDEGRRGRLQQMAALIEELSFEEAQPLLEDYLAEMEAKE